MQICNSCGTIGKPNAKFCDACGTTLAINAITEKGPHKLAIWLGLGLIIACGLYPPWKEHARVGDYGFLFSPPYGSASIDLPRLLVQWFIIAALTATFIRTTQFQRVHPWFRSNFAAPFSSFALVALLLSGLYIHDKQVAEQTRVEAEASYQASIKQAAEQQQKFDEVKSRFDAYNAEQARRLEGWQKPIDRGSKKVGVLNCKLTTRWNGQSVTYRLVMVGPSEQIQSLRYSLASLLLLDQSGLEVGKASLSFLDAKFNDYGAIVNGECYCSLDAYSKIKNWDVAI